jgi:hypothetical protein
VLGEGIRGLGAASSVSGVISNVLVIPRNEESPGVAGMSRDRMRFARGSFAGAQDDAPQQMRSDTLLAFPYGTSQRRCVEARRGRTHAQPGRRYRMAALRLLCCTLP